MAFTLGMFGISLLGIVGLFAIKRWEIKNERVLAPGLRERADRLAFRLKELLLALEADAQRLPPELLHGSRTLLHQGALIVASFLRFLSIQVHRLADFVSHKHSFRRNAPRSEFLKKVLEHKNGASEDENESARIP